MKNNPEVREEIDIEKESDVFINTCSWFLMRKVVRLLTKQLNYVLKDSGILSTQLGALAILATEKELNIPEIAKELVMDQTTGTKSIIQLQKENLVTIVEGTDKRVKNVSLTELGKEKLQKALPLWAFNQQKIVEILGEEKVDFLEEILNEILVEVKKEISLNKNG